MFVEPRRFCMDLEIVQWHLWTAMDPVRLSPEDLARREEQRKWYRRHLLAQPDPYGGKVAPRTAADGTTKQKTAHQYKFNEVDTVVNHSPPPHLSLPLHHDP